MSERVRKRPLTRERLLAALSTEAFRSGAALAEQLEISRAAVWKQLEVMESAGLGLERRRGQGYRLKHPVDLLDPAVIARAMGASARAEIELQLWERVDSTSLILDEAPRQATAQACLAEAQVAGRGRRGRGWVSAYGAGLPLSLRWRFDALAAGLSGLAPAVAVSLADALEALGARDLGLKWPNDVHCADGKLAGILIELRGEPTGPCQVIIGMGINWAAPWQAVDQAVAGLGSVFDGDLPSRSRLAGQVLRQLHEDLPRFAEAGFPAFSPGWARRDVLHGKPVRLDWGQGSCEGIARGLDEEGGLCIEEASGAQRSWQVGEASVRPREEA